MQFPLSFFDISLWLAITAMVLLMTYVLLSSRHGQTNTPIDKKKLKNVTLAVSILFLITVAIRIISIIILNF